MKRATIVPVLVLLSLMLYGCIIDGGTPPAVPTPTPTPQSQTDPCLSLPQVTDRDVCYEQQAIASHMIVTCEKISLYSIRDDCIAYFAIYDTDPSLCTQMRSDSNEIGCYSKIAAKTKNYTICDSIADAATRRQCHIDAGDQGVFCADLNETLDQITCYAKSYGQVHYCWMANVLPNVSDACTYSYANYTGNASFCSLISNISLVDECYTSFARAGNHQLCANLSTKSLADACFEQFLPAHYNDAQYCTNFADINKMLKCSAVAQKTWYNCKLINDSFIRADCLLNYSLYYNTTATCAEINVTTYRNTCYSEIALKLEQPLQCGLVTPDLEADKCYKAVAEKYGKADYCSHIVQDSYRYPCQRTVAVIMFDPSICNAIGSDYYRNQCYSDVINTLNYQITSCDALLSQSWKDECYYRGAVKLNSSEFCKLIHYDYVKVACYKAFYVNPTP